MPTAFPPLEPQNAQINEVVIPSKMPKGHQQRQAQNPHPTDATLDSARSKTSPIRSHPASNPNTAPSHSLACVTKNGNPTGAYWDDIPNLMPLPHLAKRKLHNPDERTNPNNPPASKRTAQAPTTPKQREERQRKYYDRLATVNGVVIPSKQRSPAELSCPGNNYEASGERRHRCPICGRLHTRKTHVQSHFAYCVEKNGNPKGVRWDHAWKGGGSCGVEEEGTRVRVCSGEAQEYHQMQENWPDDCELVDSLSDGTLMDNLSLDGYHRNEPQSVSSASDGVECYDADLQYLDLQLASSSSTSGGQRYGSSVRMDRLSNEALLLMVHEWQEVVYDGEEAYAMRHPHFQQTMKELEYRGLLDASWTWVVNFDTVDMAFTRTTA